MTPFKRIISFGSVSEPLTNQLIDFGLVCFFLIWFGFFSSRSVFSSIFFIFDFQTDLYYVQIKKEKKLNIKRKILILINYYDLTFYVVQVITDFWFCDV